MARDGTDWLEIGKGTTYFHLVHRPLQCLIFITPLLAFYQVASFVVPVHTGMGGWSVVAFVLMLKFFAFFGAFGNVLPLLTVVAILLSWHLARRDPWEIDLPLYGGMAAESIIWGIPFVILGLAVQRHFGGMGLMGAGGGGGVMGTLPWKTEVVLSVGAGVYEELLFRLIGINILSMLFVDILELKPGVAMPLMILISAVLFSLYHYLGAEPFSMDTFGFRTAMGIYFAGVYVYRGFGIAVGAHTAYDLIVVAFTHS
jgi:hypothetical protein